MMQDYNDVLIIGNGLLAYSSAFILLLRDPALKVAIVRPVRRTGAATTASGAMLGCFGEVTQSEINSIPGEIKYQLGRFHPEIQEKTISVSIIEIFCERVSV